MYLQRYFSLPAKAHILSLFLFPVSTNYVMKMINCFIPFLSLPQARQTVRALGLCDRIKNIYLLATEKIPDEVEGCEMLMIDSPASTALFGRLLYMQIRPIHCYIPNIRHSSRGSSPSNACWLLPAIRMPECFMRIVTC